ncbi:MAG: ABC transporter permease [Lachnospiraceae bacterium]|nr:ABC transporter permease [Lachnospiraceae bacterium]MBD5483336.1 ABC transporter permease [Lachnospiraceae bacterium]
MRAYVEFAVKKFQDKMAYRLDFFMGIVNTAITIVVYLCIYKALYGGAAEVDGISYRMVATSFVITLGLSNAFDFNEMFLEHKIHDGSITNEFLKPVSFLLRMLAENIGEGVFKLVFHFLPALLFTMLHTKLCPPKSAPGLIAMFISVAFGYLILWLISFMIQTWSFWLFSVWGIITIKNVFVNIMAGTLLPLWFMPAALRKIISFTPFESIYFTPVRIYLGELSGSEILSGIAVQILWIVILGIIANLFWKRGVKKLVVQGG